MIKALFAILLSCLIRITPSENERIVPIQQVKFFEDETNALNFESVYKHSDSLFKYHPEFTSANYQPDVAYWVFYDFCISDKKKNYILEFYDQTIDVIDVYIRHQSDSSFTHYTFGDRFPFQYRSVDHKNFQIKLNHSGQYFAYVRVVNREYADIRVAIRSVDRFIEYALSEYFLYGIFYGMIIIISLYNVFIYSAIREIKYIYYTLYIISVGIFAMCVDGIAYQLLWPNSPVWNQIAHGVALFSLIVWSIIFSKKFLRLKIRSPRLNKVLDVIFVIRILVFVYALFVDHSVFNLRYIEIIPLSVIFIGSLRVYSRGYKPARFFIVAYGFLFMGFILKALMLFSFIPTSWITYSQTSQILFYYSLHLCFILEMLFLSLALSDRVRILKENKDRAFRRVVQQHEESIRYKDRVNSQLEARIKARTEEISEKNKLLEQSNRLLEKQKQEISEINSLLDLDNWKLRNDLRVVQKERLINRVLSFEDFKQIFNNKEECLKFLAYHKWKDSYSCKRCLNSKYHLNPKTYSRRCTKCGYVETPKVDTLFHGVRFPLRKALYILYLFLNNDDRTLVDLSKQINLRKNTIGSFRKKITEYVTEHGKANLDIFKEIELQATTQ